MEEIYSQYRDRMEFFVIYVQEAHPTDGWQTDSNVAEGVLFRQHQSYEEREEVAQTCSLDNGTDEAYGAAPERLYVIEADGKVFYKGGAGPHFFDLDEWEQAIEACLKS